MQCIYIYVIWTKNRINLGRSSDKRGRCPQARARKAAVDAPVHFTNKCLKFGCSHSFSCIVTWYVYFFVFLRWSRMMGKDLDELSYSDLHTLEQQLTEGILSVKDRKVMHFFSSYPFHVYNTMFYYACLKLVNFNRKWFEFMCIFSNFQEKLLLEDMERSKQQVFILPFYTFFFSHFLKVLNLYIFLGVIK